MDARIQKVKKYITLSAVEDAIFLVVDLEG